MPVDGRASDATRAIEGRSGCGRATAAMEARSWDGEVAWQGRDDIYSGGLRHGRAVELRWEGAFCSGRTAGEIWPY